MPAVSIITPTCNRSALLLEAIRSVQGQTLPEYEHLVIDDGSADDTVAAVMALGDPRIRLIQQAHAGRSAARNRGLAEARGTYVTFLDDDDLYLPNKLVAQVGFLESRSEVDCAVSGFRMIDEAGAVQQIVRPWLTCPRLGLHECLTGCWFYISGIMFRRRVLDRMGEWFDPTLDLAEDYGFVLGLVAASTQLAWVPEIVFDYRESSHHTWTQAIGYMLAVFNVLEKFFARPDLPPAAKAAKALAYSRHSLLAAMRSFGGGLASVGQRFLTDALRHDPALLAGDPPALVLEFADYMMEETRGDTRGYLDFLFDHLPPEIAYLSAYRPQVEAAIRDSWHESAGPRMAGGAVDASPVVEP